MLSRFLVLPGSFLKLCFSSISLIMVSSKPSVWVGSGLVGGCFSTFAIGWFLIVPVSFSWKKNGVFDRCRRNFRGSIGDLGGSDVAPGLKTHPLHHMIVHC